MTRKNVRSAQPNASGETSSRTMYRSRTRSRTGLLYHRRVSRLSGCPTRTLLVGLAVLGAAALVTERPDAADPVDRLNQFRQLARSHASLGHGDAAESPDAYRDMYALLDEEIVESLGAGGLYASAGFLQDRLEAFGEAWGAAAVDVLRVGRLVVGAFQMSDAPGVNSVRVYGRLGGEAALLTTLFREGRPTVYPWSPAPSGASQFVAAWEGLATGQGIRPLRLDLIRQRGARPEGRTPAQRLAPRAPHDGRPALRRARVERRDQPGEAGARHPDPPAASGHVAPRGRVRRCRRHRQPPDGVGRRDRRAHAVDADLPSRRRPVAPRGRRAGARVTSRR